jgi:hypothetical protein
MTELSTHFLISRALVNRVANEATMNSTMELAIDQLQTTPLESGCPSSSQSTENGRSAVATSVQCVQRRVIAGPSTWSSFNVDGTRVQSLGRDEYLVGDTSGVVHEYDFGKFSPNWSFSLGGSVVAQPQMMVDLTGSADFIDLIPIHRPTRQAGGCGPAMECVAVLLDTPPLRPNFLCYMPANAGGVVGQPAVGQNFPTLVFFGDTAGTLWAYRPVDPAGVGESDCGVMGSPATTPGNQAIVAGPVVIRCAGCPHRTDEIYVVASGGASSYLVHFTYSSWAGGLNYVDRVPLPAPYAKGIAVAPGNSTLAISFWGGQVAVAQISSDYTMSVSPPASLPTAIAGAPYWCRCAGGDVIAVGGWDGGLYLLDASRNLIGSFQTGSRIRTTPSTDNAGNWFVGADDGYVYEVKQTTPSTLSARYGPLGGQIWSSPVAGSCHSGQTVCVYLGLQRNKPSIVPLDNRRAVFNACMSTSPPACSGDNPRLWARVEVGSAVSAQSVRVTGWSYYSP